MKYFIKKLVLAKFSKPSFLKNYTSRAELFDQKLEQKSELSEASIGLGATLVKTVSFCVSEAGTYDHDPLVVLRMESGKIEDSTQLFVKLIRI